MKQISPVTSGWDGIFNGELMPSTDYWFKVEYTEDNTRKEFKSHTDSRGSDKYNMNVSERRAKATVQYLISKGIAKERISGQGFGESQRRLSGDHVEGFSGSVCRGVCGEDA